MNKIDLLNDDTFVDILIHDIRRYNQIAPLYQTIKSNVDLSNILYQNLFDTTTAEADQCTTSKTVTMNINTMTMLLVNA